MKLRNRRRLNWLVPTAVLSLTAGVTGISRVLPASADSVPVLPALSPAQLLEKVRTASVTTLSGDITLASHLGLPNLASFGVRGGTVIDLLTGSHTAHVWIDGTEHVRVALDSPQAENGWIRNGTDLWSWDSSTQHVQHTTVAADRAISIGNTADATDSPTLDPVKAADELLASIDPTTAISVRTPGYVAGRPVYELVVAPRSTSSTIADGVISVDADTGIPLAVRIDAVNATTPAVQVAFTSVSFDKPAASTFEFTPPPGSTVEQVADPTMLLPLGGGTGRHQRESRDSPTTTAGSDSGAARSNVTTVGTGWDSVAIMSGVGLGQQFQALFANSPTVTVGSHTAHLVSTSLINVLVLDDGRAAVGAVTPDALASAVAGS